MEKTLISVGLFVLVIVVGLAIGLRLSPKGPQRKAVVVAFALMAAIAALFYVFAMVSSYVWTAPIFAVAAIVIPIAAYTLIVRKAKPAATVSRRSPHEVPRPIHTEGRTRGGQKSSALGASVMPAAPNHPVNEFYDLKANDAPAEEAAKVPAAAAGTSPAAEASRPAAPEKAEAGAGSEQPVGALIDEYLVEVNDIDDGLFEPEPSPTLHPHHEPAPVTSSSVMVTVPHPEGDERFLVVSESTSPANPILAYRRTTSSHLVHLGVSKNGDAAEAPLVAAALASRAAAASAAESAPAEAPAAPAVVEPVPAAPAEKAVREESEAPEKVRGAKHARVRVPKHAPKEEPVVFEPEPTVDAAADAEEAREALPVSTLFDMEFDFAPVPEPVFESPFRAAPEAAAVPAPTFEPVREPTPTPDPAFEPEPSCAPEPVFESAPVREPAPIRKPDLESEPEPAPASVPESPAFRAPVFREPVPAVKPAAPARRAPASIFDSPFPPAPFGALEPEPAYEPEPVYVPEPEPTPVSVYEPLPTFEPAYEPEPSIEPAYAAASAYEPEPIPEPVPLAEPVFEPAPEPAPASAYDPEPFPAPAPAAAAPTFDELMAKADGLRERGLPGFAARVYGEAAVCADSTADNHRARFEEIACYLTAGQGDRARILAAALRSSSVLTRIERIKLDAIERMG